MSYDAAAREQALASLGVQGIPHLTVLGRNGQTLETNAVQVIVKGSLCSPLSDMPSVARSPLLSRPQACMLPTPNLVYVLVPLCVVPCYGARLTKHEAGH